MSHPYYIEQKITQQIMDDRDAGFYSQIRLLQKVDLSKTNLDLDALFVTYTMRLYLSLIHI